MYDFRRVCACLCFSIFTLTSPCCMHVHYLSQLDGLLLTVSAFSTNRVLSIASSPCHVGRLVYEVALNIWVYVLSSFHSYSSLNWWTSWGCSQWESSVRQSLMLIMWGKSQLDHQNGSFLEFHVRDVEWDQRRERTPNNIQRYLGIKRKTV